MSTAAQDGLMAVIGMAGRFPGARDVAAFWENVCAGVESISRFTRDELLAAGLDPAVVDHPGYVPARGTIDDPEGFDAELFGFSAREAQLMDPQHRIFLECAWAALEDAGHDPEREDGRIGVFAGSSAGTYLLQALRRDPSLLRSLEDDELPLMVGVNQDFLATRVAYKLGLRGPALTVQTACSTSLVAIHLACQSLLTGESDLALAGGVAVQTPNRAGYVYHEGGAKSPDGRCRAFDRDAQGTVGGSGAGIVVLRRLDDALADGDRIVAVVRGTAVNNDGQAKVGFTAPSVSGQAEVLADALAVADVDPATVGLIEAHGTGTALGDPIEARALRQAYGPAPAATRALGSVKPNIGHLDAAAGVTGFIKAALAVEHGTVPPSLNFSSPNPQLDLDDAGLFVPTTRQPWPQEGGPRRAAVSSFGIGGTNAHAILEQAPADDAVAAGGPSAGAEDGEQLLLVSAHTPTALETATARLADHLEAHPGQPLAAVARTLATGRRRLAHRRYAVAGTHTEAAAALRSAPATHQPGRDRPVVFLFPGGGTQRVGMGAGLHAHEPVFRAALDRCAEIARPLLGLDVREILFPAPHEAAAAEAEIQRTAPALAALFAVEHALAQQWLAWGVEPTAMAGHSLGEYVAACVAGVLSVEDAVRLVVRRGLLLETLPAGSMLALPLAEEEARALLPADVAIGAVNGPANCVVSGPEGAIARLAADLSERRIEHRRLRIRAAGHSPMIDPVLGAFEETVRSVRLAPPRVPYVSNVTGTWITEEQATDPAYWVRHLRDTVRFGDCARTLTADGDRALLEVGPGRTLATLVAEAATAGSTTSAHPSLRHASDPRSDGAVLRAALGDLWLAGVSADWDAVCGAPCRRVPLPAYPFEHRRFGLGSDAGAPAVPVAADVPAAPPGEAHERPATAGPYVEPRTELEHVVAAIWADLLGFAPIGTDDNFYALGGHSLLATRLVARLRDSFEIDLPLERIFEAHTVADQAAALGDLLVEHVAQLPDDALAT